MRVHEESTSETLPTASLLRSVAEQLKLPLTIIARQVELDRQTSPHDVGKSAQFLQVQVDAALSLVDCYLLGLRLAEEQTSLALEPVSLAATLTDTTHELYKLAKQYDVNLELEIAGRYEPVMAHAAGLKAALVSLGYGLVEAQAAHVGKRRLRLAVHRTPRGVVAGLYGGEDLLRAADWRRALATMSQARQATALSTGSGAGLFVAEAILQAMDTHLRVGRYHRQSGLAATFRPSRQLQLI